MSNRESDGAQHGAHTYQSYHAAYCESCGHLKSASDEIVEKVREPVHRVDILEALGGLEDVGETTATEQGDCDHCGGTVVDRHYTVGEVPEPEYEPEDNQIEGRDPDEDALIETSDRGWQEVSEESWVETGDDDE